MRAELLTIGHSTRTMDAFLGCLTTNAVATLVDVRRFPHSRRNPQYNADELKRALFHAGIKYEFLGDELGGHRDEKPGSPHHALVGSGFQAYADHMGSSLFEKGLVRLERFASARRTAVMCSERLPKDCHRKLLADHLVLVRDYAVRHVLEPDHVDPHVVTPTARTVDGRVRYDANTLPAFDVEGGGAW